MEDNIKKILTKLSQIYVSILIEIVFLGLIAGMLFNH